MPSPFPGMDPYLERYWEGVHAKLIGYIADDLAPQITVKVASIVAATGRVEDGGKVRSHRVWALLSFWKQASWNRGHCAPFCR